MTMLPHEVYRNAIGSSDLPAVMADVMQKALLAALAVTPGTYKKWVTTKGKVLKITRQSMVNNETNLLRDVSTALARAIDGRKNRDCYDLLTSNALAGPLLHEDNNAVFHADHGNINANSGAVSVESVGKAEELLMNQKDLKPSPGAPDSFLNLTGKYLIAGTQQRLKTIQTVGSPFDPAFNGQVMNPYNNGYLYPVFDAYLQSKLTAAGRPNGWILPATKITRLHL